MFDFAFFLNSILFGIGLAMDAFSVSLANGLGEPKMKKPKMCLIAGTFAFFQAFMPLLGWFFVHTMLEYFKVVEKFIPYISLVLLVWIGGKMILESLVNKGEESNEYKKLTFAALVFQGIATSIDALSVGFTIASLDFLAAFVEAIIIAAMTFVICVAGLIIGKLFGTKLSNKAGILGGCVLIVIGIEVFLKGVLNF